MINVLSSIPVWFMQFTIYDLFNQWESIGVFDLLLPFLLVFAVIFGVLATTGILGGHRGVNLIISLVIALLAMRLINGIPLVSIFFSELFPRFAVGLSVLVVVVILAGLFIHPKALKGWFIGLGVAGILIGIIVVLITFNTFYWFDNFFWQEYWGAIIGIVILAVVISAIFVTAKPRPPPVDWEAPVSALRKMIGG